MNLGVRQILTVVRIKEFGAYLAENEQEEAVLLPKKQVPEGTKIGDSLEVFLYRDSSDRCIATTKRTLLQVGEVGRVMVKDVGKIGAFVDIGLERDVLLPYKEMRRQVSKGENILAALYVDRTHRLAVTMRIYPYLQVNSPFEQDDEIEATVYEIKQIGALVAVEDRFYGLIPASEIYEKLEIGQTVHARVVKVREDGKLDLGLRKKAYMQLEIDAKYLEEEMKKRGGHLGMNDSASPEQIKREYHLSKKAFKRAVGHLLKEGKIKITDEDIVLL